MSQQFRGAQLPKGRWRRRLAFGSSVVTVSAMVALAVGPAFAGTGDYPVACSGAKADAVEVTIHEAPGQDLKLVMGTEKYDVQGDGVDVNPGVYDLINKVGDTENKIGTVDVSIDVLAAQGITFPNGACVKSEEPTSSSNSSSSDTETTGSTSSSESTTTSTSATETSSESSSSSATSTTEEPPACVQDVKATYANGVVKVRGTLCEDANLSLYFPLDGVKCDGHFANCVDQKLANNQVLPSGKYSSYNGDFTLVIPVPACGWFQWDLYTGPVQEVVTIAGTAHYLAGHLVELAGSPCQPPTTTETTPPVLIPALVSVPAQPVPNAATCTADGILALPGNDTTFTWSSSPSGTGPGTYTVTVNIGVAELQFPDGTTIHSYSVTVNPKGFGLSCQPPVVNQPQPAPKPTPPAKTPTYVIPGVGGGDI